MTLTPALALTLLLGSCSLASDQTLGRAPDQSAPPAGDRGPHQTPDRSSPPPGGHERRAPNPAAQELSLGGLLKRGRAPPPGSLAFDGERLWSSENDWEPTVAAAPDGAQVYQMTTRYGPTGLPAGSPDPVVVFRRSLDGGASWAPDQLLDLSPGTQNDPQLATAEGGVVYAAWLAVWTVVVARSLDHGASWSAPVPVLTKGAPPHWSDKPVLVCSADGGDVYVAFNASDSWVVASHDFGQNFGAPVKTSNDSRYWFHTGGAVAPDGRVFFAATDYSQNYHGVSHARVLASPDGGATWVTSTLQTSAELPACDWSPGCPFGFLGPSASLTLDAAGQLDAAWNAEASAGAAQQLFFATSPDGLSWSTPRALGAPTPGVNHAFAALASGRLPGDLRLVWQDDQQGTGHWNTWTRRSLDGGLSWSDPVRLSDNPGGTGYKSAAGYDFPYGDYLGLAVDGAGRSHVIWGEGASIAGPGGCWFTRGP